MQNHLAELIALVGGGNVWRFHKFFSSSPNTFGDNLLGGLRKESEDFDMKEVESACHDLTLSESVLGGITSLLCDIFDASVRAIVIMIKLMQCSEVSAEAQSKAVGVLDYILR